MKTSVYFEWATILLVFGAAYLLTLPLSRRVAAVTKRRRRLKPQVKALERQYAGDRARALQKIDELYDDNDATRREAVFLAIAQLPVWWVAYWLVGIVVAHGGHPAAIVPSPK